MTRISNWIHITAVTSNLPFIHILITWVKSLRYEEHMKEIKDRCLASRTNHSDSQRQPLAVTLYPPHRPRLSRSGSEVRPESVKLAWRKGALWHLASLQIPVIGVSHSSVALFLSRPSASLSNQVTFFMQGKQFYIKSPVFWRLSECVMCLIGNMTCAWLVALSLHPGCFAWLCRIWFCDLH